MLFSSKNPPPGYYVYAYLREDGTPYYVGKGSGKRAWAKHGVRLPKNQYIEIIYYNLTELWAFAMERWFIRWYGRKNNSTGILRNLTDGGEGTSGCVPWNKNKKMPEKAIVKMRQKATGRIQTKETINKRVSKNTGKKRSLDQKQKSRESQLTRFQKTPVTDATRKKQSDAKIGNVPWNKGKKILYKGNCLNWEIIDITNNSKNIINSLREWCINNNLPYKSAHAAAARGNIFLKKYKLTQLN